MKVGKYPKALVFIGVALFMLLAPMLSLQAGGVSVQSAQAISGPVPANPGGNQQPSGSATLTQVCGGLSGDELKACTDGYNAQKNGKNQNVACESWFGKDQLTNCIDGYQHQAQDATDKAVCGGYTGDDRKACDFGYSETNQSGKNVNNACPYTGSQKDACLAGFNRTVGAGNTSSSSGDAKAADSQCLVSSGDLGWIICPVIQVIDDGINFAVNNIIVPLLKVQPLSQDDSNGVFALWKAIRNIADVGFVLIFMFIIFANTLSINVNAYTAKKMLPRLVAAVILVQFSFLFASLAIDIGNILGAGIAGLIQDVLNSTGHSVGSGSTPLTIIGGLLDSIVGLLVGLIAFAVIGPAGVLLFVGTALIGAIGAAFTLVARQLIIQFLVVISPIALAAWVLPGTENLFKKWYENFIKLILMYPIIILLLSMGNVLGQSVNGTASGLQAFLAALFPLVAFLAIPATFKASGGLMKFATGAILDRASGAKKAVRGSQFAKDMRQQRRDEGVMRSFQAPTAFGRRVGMLQAGQLLNTRAGNQRRRKAYNKIMDDEGKAANTRFNEIQAEHAAQGRPRGDFINELTQLAQGRSAMGLAGNQANQVAALKKLADMRAYGALRDLRPQLTGSQAWTDMTQDKIGQFIDQAPDVLSGNFTDFESITPERLAGMHASTITELTNHIADLDAQGNTAQADRLRQGLMNSIGDISTSPQLRNKMSREAVAAVLNGTVQRQAMRGGQVVTVGPAFLGADAATLQGMMTATQGAVPPGAPQGTAPGPAAPGTAASARFN